MGIKDQLTEDKQEQPEAWEPETKNVTKRNRKQAQNS